MKRASVFVTHSPSALANYYGPRALAALRGRGRRALQPDEAPWNADTLAAAA